MLAVFAFLLLLGMSSSSSAPSEFFLIERKEMRCFQVDFPPSTIVAVEYTLDPVPTGTVTIKGPTEKNSWSDTFRKKEQKEVMLKTEKMAASGSLVYTSQGLTHLCFKSSVVPSPSKCTLSIKRSHPSHPVQDSLEFGQILTDLNLLRDRTTAIIAEADYTKAAEVEFHDQSLKMNRAAVWWPVVQIMVLIVTGFAWVVNITAFFRKKKLV